MMILTDLPLELFQSILTETVHLAGIRDALQLRLISKAFDSQVQRAIYLLPTFEHLDHANQPLPLRFPPKMHPSMTTRLILLKYDTGNPQARPLFQAMDRALTYLESHTKFANTDARARRPFIEALATAAARNLRMYDVVTCLHADPGTYLAKLNAQRAERVDGWRLMKMRQRDWPRVTLEYVALESELYIDSAAQDALIAALGARRVDLAETLLKGGGSMMMRSRGFGAPVELAARMGLKGIVRRALGEVSKRGANAEVTLEQARRMVLKAAVEGNQEDLVRITLGELEESEKWEGDRMSRMIRSAVRNQNEGIALMLLGKRTPIPSREKPVSPEKELERRESRFWDGLEKVAVRYRCENVLKIARKAGARRPSAVLES